MKSSVSVILPCYNEGRRIIPVIDQIALSKFVTEIIVVDDGSTAETKEVLKKIKNIKLLTHPTNKGKAQALKTGLLQAKGEIVAFIDSDLTGFTTRHLDKLLTPVLKKDYDICLSERDREFFRIFGSGFVIAFTGERAMSRNLLMTNLDIFDQPGYLVEAAFNKKFFSPIISVCKTKFNKVSHCPKFKKQGYLAGLYKDSKMCLSILKYLGPVSLFKQVKFAKSIPLAN